MGLDHACTVGLAEPQVVLWLRQPISRSDGCWMSDLVPIVVDETSRGEHAYDIYSRAPKARGWPWARGLAPEELARDLFARKEVRPRTLEFSQLGERVQDLGAGGFVHVDHPSGPLGGRQFLYPIKKGNFDRIIAILAP